MVFSASLPALNGAGAHLDFMGHTANAHVDFQEGEPQINAFRSRPKAVGHFVAPGHPGFFTALAPHAPRRLAVDDDIPRQHLALKGAKRVGTALISDRSEFIHKNPRATRGDVCEGVKLFYARKFPELF